MRMRAHAHLVIDAVKLGEKYPIDEAQLLGIRVVSQCPVELDELVHRLVAHQSLTDKQDQVWVFDSDQLEEGGEDRRGKREDGQECEIKQQKRFDMLLLPASTTA